MTLTACRMGVVVAFLQLLSPACFLLARENSSGNDPGEAYAAKTLQKALREKAAPDIAGIWESSERIQVKVLPDQPGGALYRVTVEPESPVQPKWVPGAIWLKGPLGPGKPWRLDFPRSNLRVPGSESLIGTIGPDGNTLYFPDTSERWTRVLPLGRTDCPSPGEWGQGLAWQGPQLNSVLLDRGPEAEEKCRKLCEAKKECSVVVLEDQQRCRMYRESPEAVCMHAAATSVWIKAIAQAEDQASGERPRPDLQGTWRSNENIVISIRKGQQQYLVVTVAPDSPVTPTWTPDTAYLMPPGGGGKPWGITFWRNKFWNNKEAGRVGVISEDEDTLRFPGIDETWTRLDKVVRTVCPSPGISATGLTWRGPELKRHTLTYRGSGAGRECMDLCAATVGCAAVVTESASVCVLMREASNATCEPSASSEVWVNPKVQKAPTEVALPTPGQKARDVTLNGQDLGPSFSESREGFCERACQERKDCVASVYNPFGGARKQGTCQLKSSVGNAIALQGTTSWIKPSPEPTKTSDTIADGNCLESSPKAPPKEGWNKGVGTIGECMDYCRWYGPECRAAVVKKPRGSSNRHGTCSIFTGYEHPEKIGDSRVVCSVWIKPQEEIAAEQEEEHRCQAEIANPTCPETPAPLCRSHPKVWSFWAFQNVVDFHHESSLVEGRITFPGGFLRLSDGTFSLVNDLRQRSFFYILPLGPTPPPGSAETNTITVHLHSRDNPAHVLKRQGDRVVVGPPDAHSAWSIENSWEYVDYQTPNDPNHAYWPIQMTYVLRSAEGQDFLRSDPTGLVMTTDAEDVRAHWRMQASNMGSSVRCTSPVFQDREPLIAESPQPRVNIREAENDPDELRHPGIHGPTTIEAVMRPGASRCSGQSCGVLGAAAKLVTAGSVESGKCCKDYYCGWGKCRPKRLPGAACGFDISGIKDLNLKALKDFQAKCVDGYHCTPTFGLRGTDKRKLFTCVAEPLDFVRELVCHVQRRPHLTLLAKALGLAITSGRGAQASAVGGISLESGTAYGPKGEFGCYLAACAGIKGDISVSGSAEMGYYKTFSDITGLSAFVGGGGETPFLEIGVGMGQIFAVEEARSLTDFVKNNIIGMSGSMSLGAGVVPFSAEGKMCYTVMTVGTGSGKSMKDLKRIALDVIQKLKGGRPEGLSKDTDRGKGGLGRNWPKTPLLMESKGDVCANEGGTCKAPSEASVGDIYFGHGDRWVRREMSGDTPCTVGQFGDPSWRQPKQCKYFHKYTLREQPRGQRCAGDGEPCRPAGGAASTVAYYGKGKTWYERRQDKPFDCSHESFYAPERIPGAECWSGKSL